MITQEEWEARVATFTEAGFQELGYPNAEVYHLERQLGRVLQAWIRNRDEAFVEAYRAVLCAMILKGFDPSGLDVQLQLPPDVMPDMPSKEVIRRMQQGYALVAE